MEGLRHYKQTEVGVIPEEWEVTTLGEVATFLKGKFLPKSAISEHGAKPCIHYGELFTQYSETIRETFNRTNETRGCVCSVANDVLMPTSDVTPRGLAKASCVLMDGIILGGDILIIRSDRSRVFGTFLSFVIRREENQVLQLVTGTTVYHLYGSEMRKFRFKLPSLTEQTAIATALSDVDALLGGLDRLIAKKRDLKQATMQQLLTGQTRLPGFQGEWEVKRLGDHVTFLRNGVNSRAELLSEGRVKYLHYGDIHASTNSFLSPQTLPSLPGAKAARLDRLRDGDVIFADASEDIAGVCKSVELHGTRETEVVSGLHTIAARFDKTVLADGFKGLLQYCPSFATHLRRLAAGTKVYATNRAHIASVEMRLPPVVEQIAIANVLSDMDAEITALGARRDKTRLLKQGMMQELLTGRTRLV